MPAASRNTAKTTETANKFGRLDCLVLDIADHLAGKVAAVNPIVAAVYPTYRPLLESVVTDYLSPDIKTNKLARLKRRKPTSTTRRSRERKA